MSRYQSLRRLARRTFAATGKGNLARQVPCARSDEQGDRAGGLLGAEEKAHLSIRQRHAPTAISLKPAAPWRRGAALLRCAIGGFRCSAPSPARLGQFAVDFRCGRGGSASAAAFRRPKSRSAIRKRRQALQRQGRTSARRRSGTQPSRPFRRIRICITSNNDFPISACAWLGQKQSGRGRFGCG